MIPKISKFNQLVESILHNEGWRTLDPRTGQPMRDTGASVQKKAYNDVIKALRFIHAFPPATGSLSTLESHMEEYASIERMRKDMLRARGEERAQISADLEEREDALNAELSHVSEDRVLDGIKEAIRTVGNSIEGMGIEDSGKVFNTDSLVSNFERWISAKSEGGETSPMKRLMSVYLTALSKNEGIFNKTVKGKQQEPLHVLISDYINPGKTGVQSSHTGRQALKKNKPQQARIVKLIKSGKIDQALELADDPTLKSMIQQYKDGEGDVTEADIVRSIYQG